MSYILVVDDDIDVRAVLMLALQDKGFKCVGATNGLEALNYMCDPDRAEFPYLILLDLNMPVMTGRQLLHVIRCCNPMTKIPLAIISADIDPPKGCMRLTKPIDLKRLWEVAEHARDQKPL